MRARICYIADVSFDPAEVSFMLDSTSKATRLQELGSTIPTTCSRKHVSAPCVEEEAFSRSYMNYHAD